MTPMDPNRREVYREREVQYNPIPAQPVTPIEPVVQPVYQAQPVYQTPVQPVVPQPVVPVNQAVAETNQYMRGDIRMQTGHKTYLDREGNLVEREDQVFEDPKLARANALDRSIQIVYFIVGVLEVLLLLRFVFRLLGAGANGLVSFIYGITGPFVMPLNGIFNDQSLSSANVLEISTLLAMVLWALVGWGITKLLYLILEPSPTSRQVYSTSRRRRME